VMATAGASEVPPGSVTTRISGRTSASAPRPSTSGQCRFLSVSTPPDARSRARCANRSAIATSGRFGTTPAYASERCRGPGRAHTLIDVASADDRVPPAVVDALLGTAVALGIALVIAAAQGGGRPPDLGAYLFAAGFGALMLLRRRAPRAVLVLTTLGLFAYYVFDYPPIGVALPVVTALFSAADAGRT